MYPTDKPTWTRHTSRTHSDRPGIVIGICLVFLVIALLVASLIFAPAKFQKGWETILVGIYLITWGCIFLAAYFCAYRSFFLRAILWFCERLPGLGGKKMARLWSACAFLVGASLILVGLGAWHL